MKSVDSGPPVVPARRYVLFFGIAATGCAADLLTKHWVFRWLGMPRASGRWWLWEGYVGIETALNEGALFGLGQGLVPVFATLSLLAAVGILVWLFYYRAAHDLLLTVALGSVMGGILGNLYDRLGLWGGVDMHGQPIHAVRDWMLLCYGQYTWPNFNIADCMLVCGAAMLAWHAFWHDDDKSTLGNRAS